MKNISKIKVLIFLIILFLISSVNSYGINMNLENTISTNTTNIVQESLTEDNSLEENINNDDTEIENSSPKVTTTNKTDEDELLTVENILSIIIIVIGILLIFLSIAILIRFK